MNNIKNDKMENSSYLKCFSSLSANNFISRTISLYWSAANDLRERLPDELWVHIMLCLRPKDVWNLGKVSWSMRNLTMDKPVWRLLVKRKNINCNPGIDPRSAYKTLRRIHKLARSKQFCSAMAKAIGPHRFIKLMHKSAPKKRAAVIVYVNIKHEALIFRCVDRLSNRPFWLKVVNNASGNVILSCSKNAQKMAMVRNVNPRDLSGPIRLDEAQLDYFARLTNGHPCGLYIQGKEESERIKEGHSIVSLSSFPKAPTR